MIGRWLLRSLSIVGLLAFWMLITQLQIWGFDKVPPPQDVGELLITALRGEPLSAGGGSVYRDIGYTVVRVMIAFGAAAAVGIPLGLWLGVSSTARAWISPAVELLRPIPPVAWVPISILAIGARETGVIFISFVGAVFPILLNTMAGVDRIDPLHVRAIRNLGAGRAQAFRQVIFPGALPAIFTGLSVGLALAWMANIGGEMITGEFGLGSLTFQAYRLVNLPLIVVGMLLIGILGALSAGLVRLLGRRIMVWRPVDHGTR